MWAANKTFPCLSGVPLPYFYRESLTLTMKTKHLDYVLKHDEKGLKSIVILVVHRGVHHGAHLHVRGCGP